MVSVSEPRSCHHSAVQIVPKKSALQVVRFPENGERSEEHSDCLLRSDRKLGWHPIRLLNDTKRVLKPPCRVIDAQIFDTIDLLLRLNACLSNNPANAARQLFPSVTLREIAVVAPGVSAGPN